jgi:DNA excision repair protein ERCC-3
MARTDFPRPAFMHEYLLTEYSLYAAMSVGLQTEDIIEVLNRLSKIPIPPQLLDSIRTWTSSYGKVKLVLKHNHYYLESSQPEMLQRLLRDPIIKGARAVAEEIVDENEGGVAELGKDVGARRAGLVIPGTEAAKKARLGAKGGSIAKEASVVGGLAEGDQAVGEGASAQAQIPAREEDDFFKGVEMGLEKGAFD